MSKKRSMAIAMAGAMVASATPAFATQAEVQTNFVVDVADQAKLVNKVGELLKAKYTAKYDGDAVVTSNDTVYEISVKNESGVFEVVEGENNTDFTNKLNAALKNSTLAEIKIVDKGHAVSGEETVNYTVSKYDLSALTAVKVNTTLTTLVGEENVKENNGKIEITLANEEVIELGVGSEMLDFAKPLDKDGNVVEDITTEDGKKSVVGFDTVKEVITAIPYTVKLTKTAIQEVEVSELFDGLYLTEEGQELVELAGTTTHTVSVTKTTSSTLEGVEKTTALDIVVTKNEVVEEEEEGNARAIEVEDGQEAIITVNGTHEELEALYNVLGADALGNGQVAVKLAGEGRFETAVEVSKQLREEGINDDAVILTSAYSLVDGLAAGPLAAQLNTSILLTGKDAAPEVTMNEIAEVLDLENTVVNELKNKTVYVIGGEGVISEAVVDQLKALKVTVERLAGNDRHETSLAVANKLVELKDDATTEAFVVGANGEADAMSISAYAAQETTPIIVTGFNSTVNEDAVEFMEDKNLTIIGGDAAVSEELEAQLDEANDTNTVDRLEGKTRFETNAAVINEYYRGVKAEGKKVENIFVAADGYLAGKDKLVDALTAAPLAAKSNAPIVLATEELTEKQTEALKLVDKTNVGNIFQVGGGILKDVMLNVMSVFGK